MASPNFTHVYAALVAVLNTKLPDVANLIIRRVILQFRRALQRNNKLVCNATCKFLAHLINQKVLGELFGLQLLMFLIEDPTEDSVDIACDFMKEAGQVLADLSPAGVNAIFERFKQILHEGEIDRKVQYSIENLFAIRKNKFKDHPGVIPELDLVDEEDQIIHNLEFDAEFMAEEQQNIFRFDPFFDKTEDEWKEIRVSILGEDNILKLKAAALHSGIDQEEAEPEPQILDFTEDDLLKLRETIYLIIMNSVNFEECAHKLMKHNIGGGHEGELSRMIVDCCMQERTYLKFFGLLAQRFCAIDDVYKKHFFDLFIENYTVIHRLQTNKIRNVSKLFAHLLLTEALDWHVLRCVTLTEEATTASSRIFLKILFQDLAENMGLKAFCERVQDPDMKDYFVGLFPTDHPNNTRFAINFFGLIGLGAVTNHLMEYLNSAPAQLDENDLLLKMLRSDSDDSDSSDSDSSSSSSDSRDSHAAKKDLRRTKDKRKEEPRRVANGRDSREDRRRENESKHKHDTSKKEKTDSQKPPAKKEAEKEKADPKKKESKEVEPKEIEEDSKKHRHNPKPQTDKKSPKAEKPAAVTHKEKPLEEKKARRRGKSRERSRSQEAARPAADKKKKHKSRSRSSSQSSSESQKKKENPKKKQEQKEAKPKEDPKKKEAKPAEKKKRKASSSVSEEKKEQKRETKKAPKRGKSASSSSPPADEKKQAAQSKPAAKQSDPKREAAAAPKAKKPEEKPKPAAKKPADQKPEQSEKVKLKRRGRSSNSSSSSSKGTSSKSSSGSSSSSSSSPKKRKRSRSAEKSKKQETRKPVAEKEPQSPKKKQPKKAAARPAEKLRLKSRTRSSSSTKQAKKAEPKKEKAEEDRKSKQKAKRANPRKRSRSSEKASASSSDSSSLSSDSSSSSSDSN